MPGVTDETARPEQTGAVEQLVREDIERKRFLKIVGAAGAASLGTVVIAACGSNAKSSTTASATATTAAAESNPFGSGDLGILNYALTLEHLEADFYKRVLAANLFSGKVASLIALFGREEEEHVRALSAAVTRLGGTPAPAPKTSFPIENANQVALLAYTVENLGAAAYLGQAPNIKSKQVLAAALSIHSVEGRHAATLGTLVKKSVTPDGAFAKPASIATVLAAIKPFVG